jgi:hypothetical protein
MCEILPEKWSPKYTATGNGPSCNHVSVQEQDFVLGFSRNDQVERWRFSLTQRMCCCAPSEAVWKSEWAILQIVARPHTFLVRYLQFCIPDSFTVPSTLGAKHLSTGLINIDNTTLHSNNSCLRKDYYSKYTDKLSFLYFVTHLE